MRHASQLVPGDTKKISVIISADMHRELKRCVLDEDTTITALVQELLNDYLASANGRPSAKES